MPKTRWIFTIIILLPACTPTQFQEIEPTLFGVGGGKIAYASNWDVGWDIFVMEVGGSNITRIMDNSVQPAWQP